MTGDPRLRKEIANIHNVDRDDVMVVAPQEGIFIAMTCLMEYLKRFACLGFHALVCQLCWMKT